MKLPRFLRKKEAVIVEDPLDQFPWLDRDRVTLHPRGHVAIEPYPRWGASLRVWNGGLYQLALHTAFGDEVYTLTCFTGWQVPPGLSTELEVALQVGQVGNDYDARVLVREVGPEAYRFAARAVEQLPDLVMEFLL